MCDVIQMIYVWVLGYFCLTIQYSIVKKYTSFSVSHEGLPLAVIRCFSAVPEQR